MGTQTVSYFSTAKLNCGDCGPADVILCVPSSLVAPKACAGEGETTYAYRFIEAELILVEEVDQGCNGVGYNYTFTYDDTQVEQNLVSGNIQGVLCKGCLTTYIEDIKGNDVTVTFDAETSTYTLINEHGCEFEIVAGGGGGSYTFSDTNSVNLTLTGSDVTADVKISATAGNQVTINGDGLYVPPETIDAISDTPSVDLTLTGTTLSADVNISADVGNVLEERIDGLYVPTGGASYTFSDTNSVDLTLTGSDVTADVIISPDAGNSLEVRGNGLYVPTALACGGFTDFEAYVPTLTLNGGGTISSSTIDFAEYAFSNELICLKYNITFTGTGGTSLFITFPAGVSGVATDQYFAQHGYSITTASQLPVIAGTDPGDITRVQVIFLDFAGNVLTLNQSIVLNATLFLKVSAGSPVNECSAITVTDTASVDLTLTGDNLEADVIISPDAGNELEERVNGLYVNSSEINLTSYTPTISPEGANVISSVVINNCKYHKSGNGFFLAFDLQFDCTGGSFVTINLPLGITLPGTFQQRVFCNIYIAPSNYVGIIGKIAFNSDITIAKLDFSSLAGTVYVDGTAFLEVDP